MKARAKTNKTGKNRGKKSKRKPEKALLKPLKKTGGRNKAGRVTIRFRGGGAKRKYRIIDFGQEKLNKEGKVVDLQYDPNRTCQIALIEYENRQRGYVLAPNKLNVYRTPEFAQTLSEYKRVYF